MILFKGRVDLALEWSLFLETVTLSGRGVLQLIWQQQSSKISFYILFLKLPWAAPVNLFKSFGEIAVVVKAAKAADGVYGV